MDAKLFILQGFLIKASGEEFIILILYQGQVTTEVMNHLKIVDHEIQGALWIVICFFYITLQHSQNKYISAEMRSTQIIQHVL